MFDCKMCSKQYKNIDSLYCHIVRKHKIYLNEYVLKIGKENWYIFCGKCNKPISKHVRSKHNFCIDCYYKSEEKSKISKKVHKESFLKKGHYANDKGASLDLLCSCGAAFNVPLCRKNTAKYCSTRCKAKYSIPKTKYFEYKGFNLRSSWELAFAQYLDSKRYTWKYEPESFHTSCGFYTPDFWVEEFNSYVEVKGYFRKDAKQKFEYFRKDNPIILADREYLLSLGLKELTSGANKGRMVYVG